MNEQTTVLESGSVDDDYKITFDPATTVAIIDGDTVFTMRESGIVVIKGKAPRQMLFDNDAGKQAIIDFSGNVVTYSGDLPVEESARLFFEAVGPFFNVGRAT